MKKEEVCKQIEVVLNTIYKRDLSFDLLPSLAGMYPNDFIDIRVIEPNETTDIEITCGILTFHQTNTLEGRTNRTHIINDIVVSHDCELELENGYLDNCELKIGLDDNNDFKVDFTI